ncbi:aldo/keto reductase [Kallotenue papyrolyticum]|uniref:aldo/keto reductase n=1 Tax=Kallotenue papyrolyticum TaxID=1325125 RepID=UPI00047852A0|nr:aldo/keto reductase [Kallotenue papyrolyticum]
MNVTYALPRRRFGATPFRVTPLCLGCAPLANMPELFGPVPEEQALALLRAVFDSPINFLDTAAAYGDGESERRIGIVLRERLGLPPGFVLATKVDRDLRTGEFSGAQVRRSLERSRKLLGRATLPIVYLHDPEYARETFEEIMAPGGAVDVLLEYKARGVIGAVGIAGGPVAMLMRYVETGVFDALITHNRYTLLNRAAEPLIELAARRGLAVVNAAPYGGGLLAKGPEAWGRYAYRSASPQVLARAQRMADICARYAVPLAAAALQFSMRDPRITSTIVGMTRPERVQETLELACWPIPEQLWAELDAVGFERDDF